MIQNLVLLVSRILMAPIMVLYGFDKLVDINNFINNPATVRETLKKSPNSENSGRG